MDYIAIFIAAFLLELTGAIYTISFVRRKFLRTMALSVINAILSWGLVIFIVFEIRLLPAAVSGVAVGTAIAFLISWKNKSTD